MRLRLFFGLSLLAGGCVVRPVEAPGCQRDDQCGAGHACTGEMCIPRAAPGGTWAVELLPRSDSMAAVTEYGAVTLSDGPLRVAARAKVTITGTLSPGSMLTSASHVILTLPPEIPGRPDLQFEGEWPASIDKGPPQFLLSVPDSVLGKTATLSVMPTAPDDRRQAPVSLQVLLATTLSIVLPSETLAVRGRLVSAIGDPRGGFIARAFQGTQLISNVSETLADGVFNLVIPSGNLATDANRPIIVELSPKEDNAPDPRFKSQSFSLLMNTDMGDLRLPAFSHPNVFRFDVRGDSEAGPPVGDAIVRARTVIAEDLKGSADYLRDGRTDPQGIADMNLLPGTVSVLRPYDISVIPPPSSPFGVKCLSEFPLAAGGTATAPALAKKIALPRKPALSGLILRADGVPVGGVTIVASRTEVDPNAQCADAAASPPASVTTDKDGGYRLLLDPGTYRIDYDPPAGAPVPRLTETAVVVTGNTQRTVQMAPGALVEGSIFGPDGVPLPSVGVHLLEVVCGDNLSCYGSSRVEPLLRGQARADVGGNFRIVLPMTRSP